MKRFICKLFGHKRKWGTSFCWCKYEFYFSVTRNETRIGNFRITSVPKDWKGVTGAKGTS